MDITSEDMKLKSWLLMPLAPKDGTTIDAYFFDGKKNVLTRTNWLKDSERWNGMAKGEQPLGFRFLPIPPQEASHVECSKDLTTRCLILGMEKRHD